MIVNDVMQQAHCEQRSEKGTKVRGGRMHASDWPEPRCGRSRALACFPGASECTEEFRLVWCEELSAGLLSACIQSFVTYLQWLCVSLQPC